MFEYFHFHLAEIFIEDICVIVLVVEVYPGWLLWLIHILSKEESLILTILLSTILVLVDLSWLLILLFDHALK